MSKETFRVTLSPKEALQKVRDEENADLVHEELNDAGAGKYIGTLIFEKYYFRSKNRAALIVIVDNLKGMTEVRAISTGSSEGLIFNFDWGAADDFAASVSDILAEFIVN